MGFKDFSNMEIDAIGEIMNIGFGAASTAVSTLIGSRIEITIPDVRLDEIVLTKKEERKIGIEIEYQAGIIGKNILFLTKENKNRVVNMFMGRELEEEELSDEISTSAACELMNQMMGATATSLSDLLEKEVNISTPVPFEVEDQEQLKQQYFVEQGPFVVTRFYMKAENEFQGEFFNIMPLKEVKTLVKDMMPDNYEEYEVSNEAPKIEPESEIEKFAISEREQEQVEGGRMEQDMVTETPQNVQNQEKSAEIAQNDPMQQQMMMMQMQQQMLNQMVDLMERMQGITGGAGVRQETVEPKTIPVHTINNLPFQMEHTTGMEQVENKELIMGVPLEVSVEIGRTRKSVREILEFTKGSLVVLDKLAGEQVDLFVNGRCIAKGDVVVVEDNFGIRITEILNNGNNRE